jgi:CRISPR system Cascade subunit CasD
VQSRFAVRDTGREPSKSGVVGLLCAALGRSREAPVDDLTALRMGVRVDQEGTVTRDYHTAQNVLKASGGIKDTEPSNRYYLTDARFLVGLQGADLDLLSTLHKALAQPVWPLYLGRKACVPGQPVWLKDGLRRDTALETVLARYPWLGACNHEPEPQLRLILEDETGTEVRPDQPISFAERRFAPRHIATTYVEVPSEKKEALCISPD